MNWIKKRGEKIIITWYTYLYTGLQKSLSVKDNDMNSIVEMRGF